MRIDDRWPTYRTDLGALVAVVVLAWLGLVRGPKVPLLGLVDLGFHELGHLVTYVFPDLVTAVAGSVTQVLVPAGLGLYFAAIRHERGSAAVCLAWAATSAADAAAYIADAPYERLELIGGDHDWAYVLGPDGFDAIGSAAIVASTVRGLGWLLVVAAIGSCVWPLLARGDPERTPVSITWEQPTPL